MRITTYSDTLGGRIAQRREAQRMTQEELADAVGASRRSVVNWENDHTVPQRVYLRPLAAALGTSVPDLLDPPARRRDRARPSRGWPTAAKYGHGGADLSCAA